MGSQQAQHLKAALEKPGRWWEGGGCWGVVGWQWSPTLLAPGTGFRKDSFSMDGWGRDGFGMIQVHYMCCALNFYYYSISSTSGHQALDPGGWGPLC